VCGIVGYVGTQDILPILINGLRKLEYRGYDSAGVVVQSPDSSFIEKTTGKLSVLEEKLRGKRPEGIQGIGHVRWATHGGVTDYNSHPHTDCSGNITLVHNGIIENYLELKNWLGQQGHEFDSETDTEVIAHLVEHFTRDGKDLEQAVRAAVSKLDGSYALAVVSRSEPGKIVAARQDSPLIVGLGETENYLASDIPAILEHTRTIQILEDGEMAVITQTAVAITTAAGEPVRRDPIHIDWDAESAEKGGFDHFMLKEIFEQPKALRDTLAQRLAADGSGVVLDEISLTPEEARSIDRVALIACGTAFHAGIVGKYMVEKLLNLACEAQVASEFRYHHRPMDQNTLLIVVSQSGETADTLAALRAGKREGARTVAICNVKASTIAREADVVIYTKAGPEIAVASTKAYTTQIAALSLLVLRLGELTGALKPGEMTALVQELRALPQKVEMALKSTEEVKAIAREFARWDDIFFIGRGLDYAAAMEGQLKLKEISYIHAEAYPAGELKHGTLALIEQDVPVVALITQKEISQKTISNIEEVRARGGCIWGVTLEGIGDARDHMDFQTRLPDTSPLLAPVVAAVPLQLLAYYAAVERNCPVDKPRNLAKSVTVE